MEIFNRMVVFELTNGDMVQCDVCHYSMTVQIILFIKYHNLLWDQTMVTDMAFEVDCFRMARTTYSLLSNQLENIFKRKLFRVKVKIDM